MKKLQDLSAVKETVQSLKAINRSIDRRISELEEFVSTIEKEEENLRSAVENRPETTQAPVKTAETLHERQTDTRKEDKTDVLTKTGPAGPEPDNDIELGKKWIMLIGVLLTVMGIGFFMKYSFEKGWVSPGARIAGAYFWGLVFLAAGNFFIRKRPDFRKYGLMLTGGAIAILYGATYFAYSVYSLIGSFEAISIMTLITLFSCVVSVFYNSCALASLAMIGGYLTPVIAGDPSGDHRALFAYITLINIIAFTMSFYKNWTVLTRIGFFGSSFLYLLWHSAEYSVEKVLASVIFLALNFLLFTFIPFIQSDDTKWRGSAGIVILNSMFSFGFLWNITSDYFSTNLYMGLISMTFAAVFVGTAVNINRIEKRFSIRFEYMICLAILYTVAGTAMLFSGSYITFFWAVLAACIFYLYSRLERRSFLVFGCLILAGATLKYITTDIVEIIRIMNNNAPIPAYLTEQYFTHLFRRLITLAGILGTAFYASYTVREQENLRRTFVASGVIFLLAMIHIETVSFFTQYLFDARHAAISVLWSIYGYVFIFRGFKKETASVRKIGIAILGVTALKVLFFDISELNALYKIFSFILVGFALMITSYIYFYFEKERS